MHARVGKKEKERERAIEKEHVCIPVNDCLCHNSVYLRTATYNTYIDVKSRLDVLRNS